MTLRHLLPRGQKELQAHLPAYFSLVSAEAANRILFCFLTASPFPLWIFPVLFLKFPNTPETARLLRADRTPHPFFHSLLKNYKYGAEPKSKLVLKETLINK